MININNYTCNSKYKIVDISKSELPTHIGYELLYLPELKIVYKFNGLTHRDDGPADYTIALDGTIHDGGWCQFGVRHRIGGPAVKDSDCEQWYFKGLLHRDNGPAETYADGAKRYYKHGKLHRLDGAAWENENLGIFEWYIEGKRFSEEEFLALQKICVYCNAKFDNMFELVQHIKLHQQSENLVKFIYYQLLK